MGGHWRRDRAAPHERAINPTKTSARTHLVREIGRERGANGGRRLRERAKEPTRARTRMCKHGGEGGGGEGRAFRQGLQAGPEERAEHKGT